jgi:Rrf2 family protein
MISRTAEYAVRAALWLAAFPGRSHTARQIAAGTCVPSGYLSKILQALARAGVVRAQPGPGGGFVLARRPEEIAILRVINAVDPIPRIHACPLHLIEHADGLCPLHARLDAALAMVEAAFRDCTLGQLIAESSARGVFCENLNAHRRAEPGNGTESHSELRRAAPDAESCSCGVPRTEFAAKQG